MSTDWLPGFERVFNEKYNGGTYEDGVPWRFVGHTVEGEPDSIAGAVKLASQHDNPPHLWCWPERDWKCQTVRLDRSAFALLHPAGTPQTNKMRAIQCEVIGFAQDMERKPNWYWDWLGEEILRPVIEAGYPINLSRVAPTTGSDGYGQDGAVRFSRSAWRIFDGVCVHANVPDNSHWDMGKANLLRMAQAARGVEDDLNEAQDKLLKDTAVRVAKLEQLLLPRLPLKVLTSGPNIGQRDDDNGEPVSDIWRWTLNMELERQAGWPRLVEAFVEALPAETGGLTEAEVKAAVTSALVESGLLGLLPGQ